MSQGSVVQTGNTLDLAIEGEGFFFRSHVWTAPSPTHATGSLKVSDEGILLTSDGLPLEPEIAIPTGTVEITISRDGQVGAPGSR